MKQQTKTLLLVGAFILFMIVAFFGYKTLTASNTAPPPIAQSETVPAVDFTVTGYDGNEVMLSEFYGKPIILNFWATWCPYCKEEMALFEEKYKEYGDEIAFLMIDSTDGKRETVEQAKSYVEKNKFTFPVYFDLAGEATYAYQASSLPLSVFIDENGQVVLYQPGLLSEDAFDAGLQLILK